MSREGLKDTWMSRAGEGRDQTGSVCNAYVSDMTQSSETSDFDIYTRTTGARLASIPRYALEGG